MTGQSGIVTDDSGGVTGQSGQAPKSVTFDRNQRSRCAGIAGHDQPEWVVTLGRNTHDSLRDKSADVVRRSGQLFASVDPAVRESHQTRTRLLNAHHSNTIEGEGTSPETIESALQGVFSDDPEVFRRQRIAVAHINAERELTELVASSTSAMSSTFLLTAHQALYSRLGDADRRTSDGQTIEPGALRTVDVEVGKHLPPTAASLPEFLERMDQVYDKPMPDYMRLIAIACAHHRAAWVHPFVDGNGRAVRLQTHCALLALSGGLWSPMPGLSLTITDYQAKLHNADMPRRGALDGRGNLTTAGLVEWVGYFLKICLEQIAIAK